MYIHASAVFLLSAKIEWTPAFFLIIFIEIYLEEMDKLPISLRRCIEDLHTIGVSYFILKL